MATRRIYLDNAATSWPKPPAVYEAVDRWQRENGASYGRGTSAAADASREVVDHARGGIARLLGESDPRRVVLTSGGTESLNLALLGLLRSGDHVVTTVCEHNAVLRTLCWVASPASPTPITVTHVGCDATGRVAAEAVVEAIRPTTQLVAVMHASNVTGAVQPIEAVAAATRDRGVRLLVDAAQTVGRMPIDVRRLGADLIAAPGHKGLLGPLGAGVLWMAEGVSEDLRPIRFGGAATGGDALAMPTAPPHCYEAGSLNLPGLAGLAAGVESLLGRGVEEVQRLVAERCQQLVEGLTAIASVRVYGPDEPSNRAGVVSFSAEGYDPHELAHLLATVAGVESRAGFHCAPRLHAALGTDKLGGLVRLSPGADTAPADIDEAVEAVRELTT